MSCSDAIKEFHAHLDECSRCRDMPFNLCIVGAEILTSIDAAENEVLEDFEATRAGFYVGGVSV